MLEISRKGVETTVITEINVKDRFIKLPIVPYLKLLPAKDPETDRPSTAWAQINQPQIALINIINS